MTWVLVYLVAFPVAEVFLSTNSVFWLLGCIQACLSNCHRLFRVLEFNRRVRVFMLLLNGKFSIVFAPYISLLCFLMEDYHLITDHLLSLWEFFQVLQFSDDAKDETLLPVLSFKRKNPWGTNYFSPNVLSLVRLCGQRAEVFLEFWCYIHEFFSWLMEALILLFYLFLSCINFKWLW